MSRSVFQARTVIYVGETSALAQPSALSAMAHADGILSQVARRTKLSLRERETGVAVAPLGGTPSAAATGPTTPFFVISLKGPRRATVLAASRLIASALLRRTERFHLAFVATLTQELATFDHTLANLRRRSALIAQAQRAADPVVRVTALGLVQDAETELVEQATHLRLELAQAREAQSRIASSSVHFVSARTPTISTLVGGTIGLIAGLLLALAASTIAPTPPEQGPRVRRRRRLAT